MDERPSAGKDAQSRARLVNLAAYGVGTASICFTGSYFGLAAYLTWKDSSWFLDALREHTSAMIGIPLAVIASFLVVSLLHVAAKKDTEIELDALGIQLRGASGPVVLWVLCFIALVVGIRVLW